jgi:hypothetical protein
MKKFLMLLSCLVALSILLLNANATTSYTTKILFKWHGFCPPHCSGGCDQPLGICLIIPFALGTVSPEEFAEGFGNADINLDGENNVHLVFHRDVALTDSTIPITQDFFIGSPVSNALGYDSVIICQGTYDVDFSIHPQYGEATFQTKLVGPHSAPIPTLTEWGLIIFGVVLVGFISWVFLRKKKAAISLR